MQLDFPPFLPNIYYACPRPVTFYSTCIEMQMQYWCAYFVFKSTKILQIHLQKKNNQNFFFRMDARTGFVYFLLNFF